MIRPEDMIPVGKIGKPHGYKGALRVDVFFEKFIFEKPDMPFFVKIDNIPVPFFVDSISGGTSGTSFIKFKDVDSDADASIFSRKELYAMKNQLADLLGISIEDLEEGEEDFYGYKVIDSVDSKIIGTVEEILEAPEYDYLIVRKEDNSERKIEIPLVEEFIEVITEPKGDNPGEIIVKLPEGFLDI